MHENEKEPITLRIFHAPSGEWAGRLFVGEEEVGHFSGYASKQEVEQAAQKTGLYPE